jgi:hypothetical protein
MFSDSRQLFGARLNRLFDLREVALEYVETSLPFLTHFSFEDAQHRKI